MMKKALIEWKLKTKPSHQVINSSQQHTNTEKPEPQKTAKKKRNERKKNRNSPYNNWSLHNHPPREIRNIIPELPT